MIQVMLADDQAMVRGALAALLALETDIEVVAQVGNGNDVLPVALEHRPDVVLMDVDMPGTDGLSATASLLERLPATRVLIVTTFGRPGFLRRAIQSGAHGFVVKDAPATELAESVRRVHAGLRGVDPALAADSLIFGDSPLTARETEGCRRQPMAPPSPRSPDGSISRREPPVTTCPRPWPRPAPPPGPRRCTSPPRRGGSSSSAGASVRGLSPAARRRSPPGRRGPGRRRPPPGPRA